MYILVIDDNQGDRLLIERELHREFIDLHVEAVGKADGFKQALEAVGFYPMGNSLKPTLLFCGC